VPAPPEDAIEITCHVHLERVEGRTHYSIILDPSDGEDA
jgi:hypothetical protein